MNVELLEKIEAESSKLGKESLLQQADAELRLFLEQCLDPDITYGITADENARFELKKAHLSSKGFWKELKTFLDRTARRELTGNAAQVQQGLILIHAPDELHFKWGIRLINKQLRAGFDIRTYNNVFGENTVKKFAVQLADVYEPEPPLIGTWYFQPKLDGNRVVFIDGKPMSRNGKEYPNCEHVIAELLAKDPQFFEKYVLDGEMMGDLGFDKSSGALRRINEKNREKATFTYYAFDIIDRGQWQARRTYALDYRTKELNRVIGDEFKTIKVVPTVVIDHPTHTQVMELCDKYIGQGFEGAMAKDASAPYAFKRAKNLLKVKKFFDGDFRIVDFYEGKGQHKGSLGGIIVEGEYKGKPIHSKVGSGFKHRFDPKDPTAVLRQDVWKNQKDWMNAVVQVQFQEATKDGSLRFPVFIMRRKDKE